MIKIENARTFDGKNKEFELPSLENLSIDASYLTLLPGLIDPHVHFRTPGMQHKEDWITGANAAIHGGYTTVFDMPNTIPPTVSAELLHEKVALIRKELALAGIPLRYELYFGADKAHFSEIHRIAHEVIGLKVFMGCSTGNLVVDDDESLHAVFAIAATQNMLVAVHAEDEPLIKQRRLSFTGRKDYNVHSLIRNNEVASRAVQKAISLSKIYGVRLYILHASTKEELAMIREAKKEGLPVFAETTPHHLFLDDQSYANLQGRAVVNPPLRDNSDREAVWEAVHSGVIDTIGSDHAPHTTSEKDKPYGECPSGMPGIETTLPLLITAYREKQISLQRIVELTYSKPRDIFNLPLNDDFILVDMEHAREVSSAHLKTKCAWSAFTGKKLYGFPKYVYVNGKFITLD